MRALGFTLRTALVGLLSLPLIGCGTDGGSGDACTPDATQACNGVAGCLGRQTCEPSGAGWGDCDCNVSPYPDAGSTDAGSTDAGSTDAGSTDAGMADAGPVTDLCLSPSDTAVLMSVDPNAELTTCSTTLAPAGCQTEVLTMDPTARQCLQTCMDASPAGGLSAGCRDCYIVLGLCVRASCAADCAMPMSVACTTCIATNCTPAFDACSGL